MSDEGAGGAALPRTAGGAAVQRQARALGDPTRFEIFRVVAGSPEPVRVAELTRRFGLNHNAVRQHLAKLCAAGLLVEEVAAPARPGRPPLQYRLAPEVVGAWGTASPYEQLSLLLLELVRTGRDARAIGRDEGRRIAGARATNGDGLDELEAEMSRRGFGPRRVDRGARVDLVLDRCPFDAAATADPDVVCRLHHGLVEGIADGLGGGLEVTRLRVRASEREGCRVEMRRTTAPLD